MLLDAPPQRVWTHQKAKGRTMANGLHERRVEARRRRSFGVEFHLGQDKKRLGISRDASAHGILVNTLSRFSPGDEVTVTIYSSEQTSTRAKARIVRVEPLGADARYPWRYLTAARFDEPIWELERVVHRRPA
jgi:ribosomal protein L21E